MAQFLLASLMTICVYHAHAMRHKAEVKIQDNTAQGEEFWGKTCSELVSGGEERASASVFSWEKCQCKYNWVLFSCGDASGKRYFARDQNWVEQRPSCNCAPGIDVYVDMEHQHPHIEEHCAVEYGFGQDFEGNLLHKDLPDFLDSAHEWCRSDIVPENKRVPKELRGLYWMKDLKLDDVAFCPSLGEWDAETLTLKMTVWNMFVFGKKPEEKVSHLAETAADLPLVGGHLVYSIKFTNSSMKEASITTNVGVGNLMISFPMWEIDETPDGTVHSQKPGDVYYRWSSIAGFETGTYYPVRIMDDDGTKHTDRYEQMKLKEGPKNTTFQRFKTLC